VSDEPTKRQLILAALEARLQTTNHTVFVGEMRELGEDDPDVAIALLVGEDVPNYQGEKLAIRLPLPIAALAKANLDAPWQSVEGLLGAIKRAVELEDRTLGGLVKREIVRGATQVLQREPGSQTVGLVITYEAPFTEKWGNP
jgi:hypothetical protein